MPNSEIVITLFTIIYGLMLADLFVSLHRLLRRKADVRWHWLPLLVVWYLFIVILKNWWGLTSISDGAQSMTIFHFIAYGHMLALLFLLSSAALPGRVPPQGIDLKAYYFRNSRYFWGLMTAVVVVSTLMTAIRQLSRGELGSPLPLAAVGVFLVLNLVLTFSRRLWVHSVLLVLFVIMVCLELLNM